MCATAIVMTQAAVDSAGVYRAKVPVGSYTVHAADSWEWRADPGPHVHVHVGDSDQAPVDILVASPLPEPGSIGEQGGLGLSEPIDGGEIERFVRAYMNYYRIPGVSLALVKDGTVVYHRGFGLQEAGGQEPVTEGTLFEAASMTKPVFTYAVARLVEHGGCAPDRQAVDRSGTGGGFYAFGVS
jgi:hypothetical protein